MPSYATVGSYFDPCRPLARARRASPPSEERLAEIGRALGSLPCQKVAREALAKGWLESLDEYSYSYFTQRDIDAYLALSAEFMDGLPDRTWEALVRRCSAGGSSAVNDILAELEGPDIPAKLPRSMTRLGKTNLVAARDMEEAICRAPRLPEGTVVFRGLNLDQPLPQSDGSRVERRFQSVSYDPCVGEMFSKDRDRDVEVIEVITIGPGGVRAMPVGNKFESELVLDRQLVMTEQKRVQKGRKTIVFVEASESPARADSKPSAKPASPTADTKPADEPDLFVAADARRRPAI